MIIKASYIHAFVFKLEKNMYFLTVGLSLLLYRDFFTYIYRRDIKYSKRMLDTELVIDLWKQSPDSDRYILQKTNKKKLTRSTGQDLIND